jgi:16S rRNA (uracil1498-N3)-methyltransferase
LNVAPRRRLLIIPGVLRRVHVPILSVGRVTLDESQARHAVDVLRLATGTTVEVFDDAGRVATGELIIDDDEDVFVKVKQIEDRRGSEGSTRFEWTIAAAVPKGERADWMIEKLSELGTTAFIPLAAARSVVLPEGRNKRERWARIATESAKQSRRTGVMRVGELTGVDALLESIAKSSDAAGWYFSTADAAPVSEATGALPAGVRSIVALIGPEGGWTPDELTRFAAAGLTAVVLTDTVLRVETAAVAAAAVIGAVVARQARP